MGFYNNVYSISSTVMPPQSITLKEKLAKPKDNKKSWGQQCMDSLEAIGRAQFNLNLDLLENYQMIKGKFIFSHYFHSTAYKDMVSALTAEFEMPSYLRHYDIISKVINTMSGEWQATPDVFKIQQVGDAATNEYLRKKIELTTQYVVEKINAEIDQKLAEQGIDVNKQDFNSEEEQQQYNEFLNQAKQQLTPIDIQKYMNMDFLTLAEIWANSQKEHDREYFNLKEMEKVEFEDMCVADRAFRHFYITPEGYKQETWNPINVFFHKSPEVNYIEDGDYVGRIFNLSKNTIIDRYGYLMTNEDYKLLNGDEVDYNNQKWNDKPFNWVYDNYLVPFKDYPTYELMKDNWNKYKGGQVPQVGDDFFRQVNENKFFKQSEGFYFVTEGYWKTQKTLIKITYFDYDLGVLIVKIVDENYNIPKEFTESKTIFDDDQPLNTYCKTQVTEVWKGIKISTSTSTSLKKDIYLGIGPNTFQFKGDFNIYGSKLPVCGQVFSVRNSGSMSLVDLMKPYQIGYNVCQNQIYQLMEKEIGAFIVFDVNMALDKKDWGGKDAWDKWMMIAKNYGVLPADTSPQNVRNSLAASGGFLPKVIDLNLASQMVSRQNLAIYFEERALSQVGFNEYRTGSYAASATATGVQQGQSKSYSQTQSYFTNFSNYLRRCLKMSLDIAQYVQSKKDNIFISYTKSDFSKAFIKILGSDLLLCDLGVFVVNSQEQQRQLDMLRQFALQNNTSGLTPPDMASIITMNSPREIKKQLETSYNKITQQQQQAQQQQVELQQQAQQQEAIKDQKQDQQFYDKLENNLDVAYVNNGTKIMTSDPHVPEEKPLDNITNDNNQANIDLKQQQIDNNKELAEKELSLKQQALDLKNKQLDINMQIQNKQTETAAILKGRRLP